MTKLRLFDLQGDITWIHVFLHVKGCMQAWLGLMQAWCEQKSSLEHSVWVSWKWKKKYNFSSMPYLLRDKPNNSLFFVHGFIWRSPCCHTGIHCTVSLPGSPHRNHQDICNNLLKVSILFECSLYIIMFYCTYIESEIELLNLELAMHGTILIKPENPHFFNSTFLTRFSSGVNWCNITSLISQYQCFLAEWCCAIVWAQTMRLSDCMPISLLKADLISPFCSFLLPSLIERLTHQYHFHPQSPALLAILTL